MNELLAVSNQDLIHDQTARLARLYANQKILITGGAGFIGSHLSERLLGLGAQVTVLDNMSSGRRSNLASIQGKIEIIEDSVTDLVTCLQAAYDKAYIFHLAAMVSVSESMQKPYDCYTINLTGTANILEAARRQSQPTVFIASSSAIYGDQQRACCEDAVGDPRSPYGFSKLMGELLCKQYAQNYGMKTVIARYFNVHGPRQSAQSAYAGVVARFNYHMALGQPITIFGDGRQRRDFVDVATVVDSSLLLAALPAAHIAGQCVNVASGTSITILELFDQVRHAYPAYQLQPAFEPARAGDIALSQADCSKYNYLIKLAQTIL